MPDNLDWRIALARHLMWCPHEGAWPCSGPSQGDVFIGKAVAERTTA